MRRPPFCSTTTRLRQVCNRAFGPTSDLTDPGGPLGMSVRRRSDMHRHWITRLTITEREVEVRFHRRAHLPIIAASGLLDEPVTVPWWNGMSLRMRV